MPYKGMNRMDDSKQKELGGYIGRLLRDSFGKGPEGTFVSIAGTFVTVYLRNFMCPMERVLMEQGQEQTVVATRDKLMQKIIPEIRTSIQLMTGVELQEIYYDWGLQNKSGMIMGISSEPFDSADAVEDYIGQQQVHDEIRSISQQTERIPSEMYSCELNWRTVMVVRNGILVAIEKELIRLGHEVVLKFAKGNLEKRYLHHNHFESILNKRVMDIFVDWDFVRDKSVIVLVLNEMT